MDQIESDQVGIKEGINRVKVYRKYDWEKYDTMITENNTRWRSERGGNQ